MLLVKTAGWKTKSLSGMMALAIQHDSFGKLTSRNIVQYYILAIVAILLKRLRHRILMGVLPLKMRKVPSTSARAFANRGDH